LSSPVQKAPAYKDPNARQHYFTRTQISYASLNFDSPRLFDFSYYQLELL